MSVVDGDTVDVRRVSDSAKVKPYPVRLAEIDAPETSQPYGRTATAELQSLVVGKVVDVRYVECDKYRRIVGELFVDGVYVDEEMVRRGAAWFYPEYSNSAAIYEVENQARDARRGLWALPKPHIEPWHWRKMSKEEREAVVTGKTAKKSVAAIDTQGARSVDTEHTPEHDEGVIEPKAIGQPFTCGTKTYCREMVSCKEASFYLEECGLTRLDGDHDGVPCEELCR